MSTCAPCATVQGVADLNKWKDDVTVLRVLPTNMV